MSIVLDIQHIHKTFNLGTLDAFHALKGLSLTINQGDFITIVGGNGAGKSTLLNAIAGSFFVDEGKFLLEGKEITKDSEEKRASVISRVFQDPKMGTAPRMTVAQNLSLAARRGQKRGLAFALNDQRIEQYRQALSSIGLGLEDRLNVEMEKLSGGQRQSIALLMATLVKPKLLLLDEHTAALDPKTSRRILEITNQQVKENQLTALMITHNLQDALTYGNRLLVLDHGQIVQDYNQEEKSKLTKEDLYHILESL